MITGNLQKVVKVAVGVLVTTGRNQRRDMERTDPVEALTWRAGQGWNEPLEDGYLSPILDRYQPALASLPPCHLSPDSCSRSISLSSTCLPVPKHLLTLLPPSTATSFSMSQTPVESSWLQSLLLTMVVSRLRCRPSGPVWTPCPTLSKAPRR